MENNEEIKRNAWNLIDDVVNRYGIKKYEEFSCPKMRALAESINYKFISK